jgi:hypothetical protein
MNTDTHRWEQQILELRSEPTNARSLSQNSVALHSLFGDNEGVILFRLLAVLVVFFSVVVTGARAQPDNA